MSRLGETEKKKNRICPEEVSGVVLIHVRVAESLELAD